MDIILAGLLLASAVERAIAGRIAAKERRHFLAVLTAAQVGAVPAMAAAKPADATPKKPVEPKPVQVF